MSGKCTGWAWDHGPAKPTAKYVLLALADAANTVGENSYQRTETIVRRTGLSLRTVRAELKLLTEGGWIEPDVCGRGKKVTSYRVCMDRREVHDVHNSEPDDDPEEVQEMHNQEVQMTAHRSASHDTRSANDREKSAYIGKNGSSTVKTNAKTGSETGNPNPTSPGVCDTCPNNGRCWIPHPDGTGDTRPCKLPLPPYDDQYDMHPTDLDYNPQAALNHELYEEQIRNLASKQAQI